MENKMHEFGSSEGVLRDHLVLNRAGTPNADDYIILVDLLAKKGLLLIVSSVSKCLRLWMVLSKKFVKE